MQTRHLTPVLALALAATLATTAQAQGTVTLYGLVDTGVEVEAVRERLRAAGIATEEREGGGFLVRDPWGIAVLFVAAQSVEA